MVRTSPIIALLVLCSACSGSAQGPANPLPPSVVGALASVLTFSGMEKVETHALSILQEANANGMNLQIPSYTPNRSGKINIGGGSIMVEVEHASVTPPMIDMEVPVSIQLQPFSFEIPVNNVAEGTPSCFMEIHLEEVQVSFDLRAGNSKSGNYTFTALNEVGSFELQREGGDCPVDTPIPAEWVDLLTTQVANLSSPIGALISPSFGTSLGASGRFDIQRSNNSVASLLFTLSASTADNALSDQGGWLGFNIDLGLDSDLHPCAPKQGNPPTGTLLPMSATDYWPNPLAAPFDYAISINRLTMEHIFHHMTRAGTLCPRYRDLNEDLAIQLFERLPALNDITTPAQITLSAQTFEQPQPRWVDYPDGPRLQVFFPRLRIDIDSLVDGAPIRLITVESPASFSISVTLADNKFVVLEPRGASGIPWNVHSPLFPKLNEDEEFLTFILDAAASELLAETVVGQLDAPHGMPLSLTTAYRVGENYLVLPFVMNDSPDN